MFGRLSTMSITYRKLFGKFMLSVKDRTVLVNRPVNMRDNDISSDTVVLYFIGDVNLLYFNKLRFPDR